MKTLFCKIVEIVPSDPSKPPYTDFVIKTNPLEIIGLITVFVAAVFALLGLVTLIAKIIAWRQECGEMARNLESANKSGEHAAAHLRNVSTDVSQLAKSVRRIEHIVENSGGSLG
jgi:hypothetical protein